VNRVELRIWQGDGATLLKFRNSSSPK